jgi:IclR family transcriptional regulator, acetate operon repressor
MIQPSVQSVERALELLFALERAGRPTRLTDLSRSTGLHKATAQRLLMVMERRGLVRKDESGYSVGLAAVPLANAFFSANDLTRVTLPVLQELAASTGETASLYQRLGFNRVGVPRVDGVHPLQYTLPVGQRLPLHLGAGKVLAATMPEAELNQMLDHLGEIRLVTGQVWTRQDFLERLRQIRERGFDVSAGERTFGATAICAPVELSDGTTIAALAVVSRTNLLDAERTSQLVVEVRRAAQAISNMRSRLGLSPNHSGQ